MQQIIFLLFLVDSEKTESKIFLKDLLKIPMTGKVIKKIILPPLNSNFKYESYKVFIEHLKIDVFP